MTVVRAGWALLLCACIGCTHLSGTTNIVADAAMSRQILVTVRHEPTGAEALVGDPATIYLRRRGYGATSSVDRLLDQIADDFRLVRLDGWQITSLGVYCEVYRLRPDQDLEAVLLGVRSDRRVESVQAMNVYETQGILYNDPYAAMQPALSTMAIGAAHEYATGRGVRVAVIDSSVDARHPEIRGHVPIRRNLVPDRKGGEPEIHGTAVAGIIASTANNHRGIVGVAPDAELVSLRACWTVDRVSGRANCSTFSLARSLEEAMQAGVDIINMSLSGPRDSLIARLVDAALARGIVVIAAVPDGGNAAIAFPASHPGVIAVGSSPVGGERMQNLIVAPGKEMLTTTPGSDYAFFSGNSMASAFVAGVSALLVERDPGIDTQGVLGVLAATSVNGLIHACAAVARLTPESSCR